ncbi:ATP-dependent RNA helicase DDX51 [Histomonas meleagridis]|uniref:ATP-dependent RNA helicase DDX51 n=1 Tax=Histomonas meleagridis TaxID=135588 RepID=UPI00355ACB9A|nr:ATP-dependent RNA helicase DDX51 [Histomonas meleagridis]KAH0797211.1 ATP-dependent RNA helicase DDX51 [Histomonas meleagridis]
MIPEFLYHNLIDGGFDFPFLVQSAVISTFFSTTSDLAIGYPTGSGKTLSYLIPIISCLHSRIVPRLRALIVVPNRELARQVFFVASSLIKNSNLSLTILNTNSYAGPKSTPTNTDIVITTAHGLSTYLIEVDPTILSTVEFIVLDEGDVILEQPLENWLEHVTKSLYSGQYPAYFESPIVCCPPKQRKIRKILCSATLSRNSKQSEDFGMVSPIFLVSSDKSRYVVPQGITEEFIVIPRGRKTAALMAICEKLKYVLCFVSTTKRCISLASAMKKLKPDLSIVEFAAAATNQQKKRALENIEEGQTRLIIATDSLARGIDLPFLDAVVNYDVPSSSRTYVHRMGRTARGGAQGKCITFVVEKELEFFKGVIEKIDGSAPREATCNFDRFISKEYFDITKRIEKHKSKVIGKTKEVKADTEDDETETEENQ